MTNSADPDQLPTDLDLHCLLRQGMSCSARDGLSNPFTVFLCDDLHADLISIQRQHE